MVLGLPYFTVLSWPARLAVIGHELGHLHGGDTTRAHVLGVASRTLAGVHYLISPSDDDLVMGARDRVVEASIGFGTVLARGVQTVLALPFLLLWLALQRLSVLDGQHREYLADRRAAAVVGTEALVEVFLLDLEGVRTAAAAAARRGEDPFAHLASRRPRTAAERAARIRELEATVHRADETHPPDHLRIRLLEADPRPPSTAMPSEADLELAEEELVRLRAASAKRLSQDLRFGRYR
jgi:Zn-dependent protease with chaperone function